MINLVPRKEIPLSLTLTTTAVAVALTLIAGATIFGILGYDPLAALYQFFIAPVSRGYQVADLFVKACPLIIIASGLVFSYRANVWNIGAEGQMILGAMFSGYVALYWGGMPAPLLLPAMILAGVLGGLAWAALYQFFIAPVSRGYQVADLFVKACPLIIIASGLVFSYRANVWNIGAEGQMILGAMFSGYVALYWGGMPAPLLLPAMILAGVLGGLAWAMIPAILKTRFNTNEILVSLMLTYVAVLFIDWTVRGPWRDPMSFGFPLTPMYPDAGMIARVDLPGIGRLAQLHWGVLGALVLSVAAWFILRRTMVGFQVQVMGDAPRAGRFAGFSPALVTVLVLGISGGAAGLAGMVEVSANIGQLQPNISFGYGFTAIIVAFLSRLNPLGVIVARLVVALAEMGGDAAQIAMGIPKVVTGVFKGILLFMLLAGETFNRFHVEFRLPGTAARAAATAATKESGSV